jgi:hypothetical protein
LREKSKKKAVSPFPSSGKATLKSVRIGKKDDVLNLNGSLIFKI